VMLLPVMGNIYNYNHQVSVSDDVKAIFVSAANGMYEQPTCNKQQTTNMQPKNTKKHTRSQLAPKDCVQNVVTKIGRIVHF